MGMSKLPVEYQVLQEVTVLGNGNYNSQVHISCNYEHAVQNLSSTISYIKSLTVNIRLSP